MSDRKVSIITPVYNGEAYIAETISSVLAQTYEDWEMLVIDDGSGDASAELVLRFAERDSRIRLLRQENKGSAAARNAGIREASGRYIALLDADDLYLPTFLDSQLAFMQEHDAICVCCAYARIDEASREILGPVYPMKEIRVRDMRVMNRIGCLTGLYDTRKYGKVYLREELKSIRDDYAYWYDIVRLDGIAFGNQAVLAKYRVLASSTTGNKLRLVKSQYRFHRSFLHASPPSAAFNTVRWGLAGLAKFRGAL